MITQIFAVYDKKTGVYGQPFTSNHEANASRSVQQAANDVSTSLGQYPADYALYRIGTFDDQNGALCAVVPEHIVEVASLLFRRPEQPSEQLSLLKVGE